MAGPVRMAGTRFGLYADSPDGRIDQFDSTAPHARVSGRDITSNAANRLKAYSSPGPLYFPVSES